MADTASGALPVSLPTGRAWHKGGTTGSGGSGGGGGGSGGGASSKEVLLLLLLLLLLLTLSPPGMQCCVVRVPNAVAATSFSDGAIALRRAPRNIANLRYHDVVSVESKDPKTTGAF